MKSLSLFIAIFNLLQDIIVVVLPMPVLWTRLTLLDEEMFLPSTLKNIEVPQRENS